MQSAASTSGRIPVSLKAFSSCVVVSSLKCFITVGVSVFPDRRCFNQPWYHSFFQMVTRTNYTGQGGTSIVHVNTVNNFPASSPFRFDFSTPVESELSRGIS